MDRIELKTSALLVVDVQQGFTTLCPSELPVPGGLEVVPKINRLMETGWARIDATQDWHPPDHCSFLGQRDHIYPPHCVAGTAGAEFLPDLKTEQFHVVWRKGYMQDRDAYAVTDQHPAMIDLYRAAHISTVVVCGIALNICCFFAARDLRKSGFRVAMARDASAGIDVPAADLYVDKAMAEAEAMGIELVTTQEVLSAVAA